MQNHNQLLIQQSKHFRILAAVLHIQRALGSLLIWGLSYFLKTENNNCLTFLFLINLLQWFSNYGPQTRSISIIWELVKNGGFFWGGVGLPQALLNQKFWGVGLSNLYFNRSSRWFWGYSSLEFEKQWEVGRGIRGMRSGVPFRLHPKVSTLLLLPEGRHLSPEYVRFPCCPQGCWGRCLREGTVPLWGPGWKRVLNCGLLPICKELFQCFLYHLGGAFDISSERPRPY